MGEPEPPAPAPRQGRRLSRFTAYTWSRQWPADMLMGLGNGVLGLVAFSLQRSMGAPEWTSPALVFGGQALWVLAPAWPILLARIRKRSTFLWLGLVSRAPFLLMALASVAHNPDGEADQGVGSWWLLFLIYLVSINVDAVYTPHRSAMMRANYPLTVRGRYYGLSQSVIAVAAIASSLVAARALDLDPTWVRVVFPVAAVVGVLAHALMARIRWRYDGPADRLDHPADEGGTASSRSSVLASVARGLRAGARSLRTDRAFFQLELAFMLYGLGLLSVTPLFVSHFAKRIETAQWAMANNFVLPVTQLAFVWVAGRLSDRIGVVRVAGISFALLIPFFLWMTRVTTGGELQLAFVLYGVAMAGVNVSWSLGPLFLAPPGRAHLYTSVHVACVGLRSVLGPTLGYVVDRAFSFSAALVLAAAFEAGAAFFAFRLARRVHREE